MSFSARACEIQVEPRHLTVTACGALIKLHRTLAAPGIIAQHASLPVPVMHSSSHVTKHCMVH
eukprot:1157281-Pelagomonas_calceolata.AAC.2